jgi:hypothetical protein
MIRCSGFCSGGRATPGRRTLVGETAPSAEREMHCCVAFANTAARWTPWLFRSSRRFLIGILTGTAELDARTWTFPEWTRHTPMSSQTPWSLRDWGLVRLMVTGFVTAIRSSLVCVLGEGQDARPADLANKMLSNTLHIANTTAKGGIIAERDAFEDQRQAEESYAQPNEISWAKEGAVEKGKIMPKPGAGDPSAYFKLLEFAITSIRDVTGVNMELLGLRDVNQPGLRLWPDGMRSCGEGRKDQAP